MSVGWYKAPLGWVFHYFPGNGYSLCRNYQFNPRFTSGNWSEDACCKDCKRKRLAQLDKGPKVTK